MSSRPRILVVEPIADTGIQLLREHFEVDGADGWTPQELSERVGDYEGIIIRSATKMTAGLIGRAERLRVIGRAGVGVDNVDVEAATKRGIIVANAPQSNVHAAAEHTMALMLALARNVPRAHASLTAGRWERSQLAGVELYGKTLGILGLGRIGQLVAQRARGFEMTLVAFDPFVSAERFRELGVEKAESSAELYARADFITLHLAQTPETRGWLNAEALAQCKRGVRVINVARGGLVDDAALKDAIDTGQVAGAALDVFGSEPITEHPLFAYPNVVVTPHLGASTGEAQDRAGVQTAEQVVAALTGGTVSTAVNIPAIPAEDIEALGPLLPLCRQLGRIAMALAEGSSVERVDVEFLGRIAERDTRLLTIAVILGVLSGHTEEDVNQVNAASIAAERGIAVAETKRSQARDFTDLVRVVVSGGESRERVVGTTLGHHARPHLLEAWGQRFNLQLEAHLVLLRYSDVPGMIGTVGTIFGRQGINVSSAAVGRQPGDGDGGNGAAAPAPGSGQLAAMAVTTDVAVPAAVLEEIVGAEGFVDGRALSL